jgi:hypothetical protein
MFDQVRRDGRNHRASGDWQSRIAPKLPRSRITLAMPVDFVDGARRDAQKRV